jgi:hypothetical protein
MKKYLILIVILLLWCPVAFGATYYIDYEGGDDTCDGLSKQTKAEDVAAENDGTCSWKNAPGMQDCERGEASPNACQTRADATTNGDTIVFKGGVTWPEGCFTFDWYFGNSTTFTVDQTWYSGASWSRPIFDLEGTEPAASPEGTLAMLRAYGSSQTVNNIEFTGAAQLHGIANGYGYIMLEVCGPSHAGATVSNNYLHGWSHGATTNDVWDGGEDAGNDVGDNLRAIGISCDGVIDLTSSVYNNVVDGSDSSPTPGDMVKTGIAGNAGHIYNNYVANVSNGVCCGYNVRYLWGNTFKNIGDNSFDDDMHYQTYEYDISYDGDVYVYNNLGINAHDFLIYPQDEDTVYIFNNVFYGNRGSQQIQIGNTNLDDEANTLLVEIFNNTFQSDTQGLMISDPSGGYDVDTIKIRNNILFGADADLIDITSDTENQVITNTYDETNATRTSWGYSTSSDDPLDHPDGDATPVDAGTDLSSVCSGMTDSSPSFPTAACGKDTAIGVILDTSNYTVSYPKRVAISWDTRDAGAYEFAEGNGQRGIVCTGCTMQ